jgi:hypothetical protein
MTHSDLHQTITRLLGPAAPEVSCDECFEQLDRYVDLEVGEGSAALAMPGLAAHLQGCPACAEEHRSLRDLVRGEQQPAPSARESG